MDNSYWRTQTATKPLFPDLEWAKPEQRSMAGRLGIIGGNKLGFAGVAEAYSRALTTGVGEVKVVLPDVLKKSIPPSITDTVFASTNPSGSLSKDAAPELKALAAWATGILCIGDAGRNSETAILYENFLREYDGPLVLTRDAVDLIKNSSQAVVERPNTLLIISFAQLQKLFQSVYYPKILTFSMQLAQLVDALHKFTITYPVTIAVLHKDHLIVASNGEATTTEWENAMAIWRGSVATVAACYLLWHPTRPLEAVSASLVSKDI
jgi:NAD(P)H-hydrate repair Nnr-like enzyme with NAD(P)H-hydrate dehydratase domain